jgi:hypothetical protein
MSARKFFFALLTLVTVLGTALPAVADELLYDSDVLTAGVQNSAISLTATPGQVQTVPVDLFISCKTQNHISGNVNVSLAAAGGNGSTVPTGGSLSAATVTVLRPSTWPTDGAACPSPTPVTAAARVSLQVGAPTATGTYQYKARWTASDTDAMGGAGDAQVTINVTVAPAAPTDSTPPVITKVVTGTAGSNGWYTSDVNVTWSVTDPESAVVIDSGCGVQNFVNETAGASSSCQAHSAGGSATASVALKIDKTGPTATLSPSGTLGQNGWYTSSVTLSATGQDAVSGGVTCSADQTQSAETTGATFGATCTNAAGLSSATNSVTVKVDKTGPSAGLAVTGGTPGSNGWYTNDVTVSTSGSDAISGGVVCSPAQTLTTDTYGTPVNGSCTNAAGLSTIAAPLTVKLDKSNPSANLSVTAGTMGGNGWYIDDVTIHASGGDNVSDPTTCAPLNQQQTANTTGQLFTADCTNDAGRTQAATPLTIKRDASAPTAHLEVVSGTPGANGWYTSAVTVRTVGADPTSGVTCSTDQVLDTETAGTVVTGYCTNGAGARTDAAPLTVMIDMTGPTAVAAVSAGTPGADGWYTSDVTVHTTGGDSVSGPVTCDADQHQTVETTGKDFTGTCTNAAGLSTVSPTVTVKLDKTGPSTVLTPSGTLGLNEWFTSDVTISTTGQDAISSGVTCTSDQHQTSETAGATFHGSCTNAAGLSTDGAPLTVKVDKSGPVATLSITSGTSSSNGWYTSNVTVHTDGSDDLSGPVTCSSDQTLTTDTDGTDVNGSCTNKAGLSTDAAALTVKLDKSNPTANLSITAGTLGDNGWYVNDVTVHTSGADNVSDPTVCTEDQHQTTDTTGQAFNGECTNDAGRTQAADPVTVMRDATPPTAHLVVSGTEGANGWYTSNVTVTVEGKDPTSGATCTGGAVLTSETQGIEVTGSCTNGAGEVTEADPVTIKIDKTAPTAALDVTAGTAGDNGWYTSDVTVATSGDDSVSGPVTCTVDQHQTSESTGEPFAGTCTNAAGLVGHAAGLTIKLDKSAPTTKLGVSEGTKGDHGWYTSNVTVHTDGTDTVSGIAICTADQSQTDETTGQTLTGTCTNQAGLTSGDELIVKLDKSGPSTTLSASGPLGAHDWYIGDVDVTTAGADSVSGPVICAGDQHQTAETSGHAFHGSCTNQAGLTTDADALTIKLDKTAPTATLTPDGQQGSNGWYTGNVTVTASGTDTVSGPVTCAEPTVLNTDTAETVVTGSCTNDAGLVRVAAPVTVKLDKSNPSAALSVSAGTLGANDWYTDDVTVHTSGADNVSEPTACTDDQYETTDTTGRVFNGECTNDAGRTQAAEPLTVKRDASPPTAHLAVISGTPGANGWYTSAVTVRATGADDQSDVTCTADVTLTADTTGTQVTGSCTNAAGLTTAATPLTVKIDTTAPTAALAVTAGTAGKNGWYTSNVTVGTSGADSVSGPVTCTADQSQTTETTGTTFNGSCTNKAGLSTDAAPLTLKLDKTAPSAALAVTGGTTGSNGWYVSDVTVSTTGTDSISNPTSCSANQTLSGETTGTVVNGSCTNAAGLVGNAAPITVKLDKTVPVVAVTNLDPSYAVGSVPTPGCTTSDATSGVAAQATPTVPVLVGVGAYDVTCNGAVDKAGNTGSATATLRSIYRWDGFLQPINDTAHQVDTATSIFKAGSTVPVKFQLKRANGTIITPASAPIWLTPVKGSATAASVDESVYAVTATSGGTYRADGDQWIYNWNTKGLAAGFYYRIGVKLDDGQTYYVNIGLR